MAGNNKDAATAGNVDDALRALARLMDLFKFERAVYMGVTVISLIVLFGSAIYMLVSGSEGATPVALGMFGSTGLITYTAGRLLSMWNQAFHLIEKVMHVEEGKNVDG